MRGLNILVDLLVSSCGWVDKVVVSNGTGLVEEITLVFCGNEAVWDIAEIGKSSTGITNK